MRNRLHFSPAGKVNGKTIGAVVAAFCATLLLTTSALPAQTLSVGNGNSSGSREEGFASSLSWKTPDVKSTLPANDPMLRLTEKSNDSAATQQSAAQKSTAQPESIADASENAVRLVQFELPSPISTQRPAQELGRVSPFPEPEPETAEEGFLNQNLSTNAYSDECPDPKSLPKITELSYKVVLPPGIFPESCPLPDEVYVRKTPTPVTFTWKASNLCHKPLYFEDVQLERYGHSVCPFLQPVISRVRFWATIPVLPYFMGVYPPNECVYELGYYRPGSCAPHMLEPLPVSLRGGLFQAGATVGAVFVIP